MTDTEYHLIQTPVLNFGVITNVAGNLAQVTDLATHINDAFGVKVEVRNAEGERKLTLEAKEGAEQ